MPDQDLILHVKYLCVHGELFVLLPASILFFGNGIHGFSVISRAVQRVAPTAQLILLIFMISSADTTGLQRGVFMFHAFKAKNITIHGTCPWYYFHSGIHLRGLREGGVELGRNLGEGGCARFCCGFAALDSS
jgi:hypothetical protein